MQNRDSSPEQGTRNSLLSGPLPNEALALAQEVSPQRGRHSWGRQWEGDEEPARANSGFPVLAAHLCLLEQRQLALQLPPVMFTSLKIKVKPAFNIQQIISILKLILIAKYLEKG